MSERLTVKLEGGRPWGFRLTGGSDFKLALAVEEILSRKAEAANLGKGDRIHAINGHSTAGLTHEQAKQLILNATNTLELEITKKTPQSLSSSTKVSVSEADFEIKPTRETVASSGMSIKPKGNTLSNIEQKTQTSSGSFQEPPKSQSIDHTTHEKVHHEVRLPSKSIGQKETPPSVQNTQTIYDDRDWSIQATAQSPTIQRMAEKMNSGKEDTQSYVTKIVPPVATANKITETVIRSDHSQKALGESVPKPSTEPKIKIKDSSTASSAVPTTVKYSGHKCFRCKEDIVEGTAVQANGNYWHISHFTCGVCKTLLTNAPYYAGNNGEILCSDDFAKSSAKMCAKCSKPILDAVVTSTNGFYHKDCFNCAICGKNIAGLPYLIYDGKIVDETCYEEKTASVCKICSKPILPGHSYISINDDNVHSSCFKCKICGEVLSSYKIRDGKEICAKH